MLPYWLLKITLSTPGIPNLKVQVGRGWKYYYIYQYWTWELGKYGQTRANKNKQRSHLDALISIYCNLRDPFLIKGAKTICITVKGGKTRLHKSKFSENFSICVHMIFTNTDKKVPKCLKSYEVEKYFYTKIRWGSTLNPSWSNFKLVLFMNYRTLQAYATVA